MGIKSFTSWRVLQPGEYNWMQSIVHRLDLGDLGPIENEVIKEGVLISCIQKCISDRGWESVIESNRIGASTLNFARVSMVEMGRLERPCVCEGRGTLSNLLGAYVAALELLVKVRN